MRSISIPRISHREPFIILICWLAIPLASMSQSMEDKEATMMREEAVHPAVEKFKALVESGREIDRGTLLAAAAALKVRRPKEKSDIELETAIQRASRPQKKRGKNIDPAELEKKQQAHLAHLKEKSGPFVEETPTRELRFAPEKVMWAAENLDQIIETRLRETGGEFNPLTTDEQFVRRIYLDAAGRIPTAEETERFLDERSATKRSDLIDRLLLSEDYPSQMYNWFAEMLRVIDKKGHPVVHEGYQAWLMDQAAGNRPWNETVFDLVAAEGNLVTDPEVGWIDRDEGVLTNHVSNTLTTFMGADVSCAECHDHPFADWTQKEFYELAGFFGQTVLPGRLRGIPKFQVGHMHFVSDEPDQHLSFPEDYAYDDAEPGSQVTPTFPLYQKLAPRSEGTPEEPLGRKDFAAWLTHPENEQFAATIANRLWDKAFGRAALVPMTVMDDLSIADNPKLVTTLAKLMRYLGFDLLEFQRIVYNTRAYQAQSSTAPEVGEPYRFEGPVLRRMKAEQAWDSLATLVKGDAVNEAKRPRKLNIWAKDVFEYTSLSTVRRGSPEDGAGGGRNAEFAPLLEKGEALTTKLLREYGGGKGSGLQGIEIKEKFARASELKQPAAEAHFLRQFGQSERELLDGGTTEGNVPQILMLLNGKEVNELTGRDSHIMKLVSEARSDQDAVEALYLSFLSRAPTSEEKSVISQDGIEPAELIWLLMNTREFLFIQ